MGTMCPTLTRATRCHIVVLTLLAYRYGCIWERMGGRKGVNDPYMGTMCPTLTRATKCHMSVLILIALECLDLGAKERRGGKDPCMGTMRPTLTRATRCHIVHSANINCMFMHGWIIGDASVMVVAVVAWLEEGADGQDKDPCIIMCRTYN